MPEDAALTLPLFDAAVIGGGPAGMAAAIALARTGARVALIGPPAPGDERTTALLAGSMELLHRIGVGETVEAAASPLRIMRIIDGTRRLVRAPEVSFDASEIGLPAFGQNIANSALNVILADAVTAAGITRIAEPVETFDFSDPDQAVAITASGQRIAAKLMVGADGRRSRLRASSGIDVKSWTYPQTAIVCNARHSADHHDTSTEFHTETGPFTLVPHGPRRSAIVCVVRPEEAERLMGVDDATLGAEFSRRSGYLLGRLTIDGTRGSWPMAGLVAGSVVTRRVALVSEAAHAFPPIGAQGLNLGLRDIAALSEAVAAALPGDIGASDVLEAYAKHRKMDVQSRTIAVDLLNRSLLSSFLPVQLARNIGLNLARSVEPFRKFLMREGMGAGLRAGR